MLCDVVRRRRWAHAPVIHAASHFDQKKRVAWVPIFSGAQAARRAAKRSPIIIEKGTTRMHKNRNPCNTFLMVKMASGMDDGRVRRRRRRRTTPRQVSKTADWLRIF